MDSISFVNGLLLLAAALVVAGILSSLLAFRFGAPLLLVFLGIGMLAGEDGIGGLPFDDYRLAYLIGSGALAVILFDGGLRTRLSAFRAVLWPAMTLATVGVVLTAALTGVAAAWFLGIGWLEALLIGSIVGSTDAAAVFFLLRTGGLQLRRRVGATLEIESATNDPAAIFLTVLLVEVLHAGSGTLGWGALGTLAQQVGIGTLLGLAGGLALAVLLNRVELPSGLHPLLATGSAVLVFAAAAVLNGSGFLAVYIAGLVVGNRPIRALASITSFQDALTWLCQIVMFIVLGLLITPSRMLPYLVPALGIALWLMLVARPVMVWLCLPPFRFAWRETAYTSWVGLRGAVSVFLSAIPVLVGIPNADIYFNVAFFVVLVSLLVQGWTIVPAARWLGLAVPRESSPVRRVELDLPGQLEYEIVGFPVYADSAVLRRGPLPRWARPILVVRDEAILQPADAGALHEGDYAYFLVPPERAARLDQLFGHAEGRSLLEGGFPLRGDAPLASLCDLYDLKLEEDETNLTVSGLFAKRFDQRPEFGDRIAVGENALIAALELEDDKVTRATLLIDESGAPLAVQQPRPGEPRSRLGRMLRRLLQG